VTSAYATAVPKVGLVATKYLPLAAAIWRGGNVPT
jgi:hypothetical protein